MRKEESDNRKLIYDYALEPELVADCDQFLYRYFTQYKKFSWDTGCVVVQYPNTWRELVKRLVGDEKRLEVLLAWLPRTQIIRRASDFLWKDTFTWLENAEAEQENSLHWFHAILARDNPRDQSNVLRGADISSGTALLHETGSAVLASWFFGLRFFCNRIGLGFGQREQSVKHRTTHPCFGLLVR